MQDPQHLHLTRDAIEAFLYRTEEPEERTVLYHLLSRCAGCREAARPLLELRRAGVIDERTSPAEIELAVSEWHAPRRWAEWEKGLLAGAATVRRKLKRLRGEPGWPTWGLVAWLAHRCLGAAAEDVEAAVEWGKLAVSGGGRLHHEEPAPEEWNMELRAFAQAALGDALRRRGDEARAATAFDHARQALEAYAEDPADFLPYRPRVLELEAAWHRSRGRYRQALERLGEAAKAWETVYLARPEDRARVPLETARVLEDLDDPDSALAEHERALEILQGAGDPALRLHVEIRRLFLLARSGRMEAAATGLAPVRNLAEDHGSDVDRLRLRWVEARVYAELEDDPDLAEELLREVLEGLCTHREAYDAALAALDLARLLLARGRPREVEEMARAMQPLFEALDVEAETRRALKAYMAERDPDEPALLGLGLLGPALLGRREAHPAAPAASENP